MCEADASVQEYWEVFTTEKEKVGCVGYGQRSKGGCGRFHHKHQQKVQRKKLLTCTLCDEGILCPAVNVFNRTARSKNRESTKTKCFVLLSETISLMIVPVVPGLELELGGDDHRS